MTTGEEKIMKPPAKDEVKGRTKERLRKPQVDPPLEGKDGGKTGREKERDSIDWPALLTGTFRGKTVVECGAGCNVFLQGQPADSLFYVRRGQVKLSVTSPRGKEATVAVLGAGEFFGEGCLA